ncbi:cupin domain-containing protein [Actinomadura geliboluensis]|jgi:quercetin dioxygenase-like cupin family protein|uniref:Cupin domain-containing protein n=1 Tax=Actinomadura geliboluensis TaxID=882440 RepID=A0A5S4HAM5_9ACTN|nr:cupin domain-containing protein [Actinomadura geliboluensis]TMR42308.1 cupin domain-containing protein [Actinomadura geliboluensis]
MVEKKAVVGSASALAEFRADSFCPKVLSATDLTKVMLVGMEDGQEIPLHTPGVELALAILEGAGEVWVGDGPHAVAAGDVVVIPAGTTRGVRARGGRLVFMNVVSPPPTAADHEVERRPWPVAGESSVS